MRDVYRILFLIGVVGIVSRNLRETTATPLGVQHEMFTLRNFCPSGLSDGSGDISLRQRSLTMEGQGQHRVLRYRFDYDDRIQQFIDKTAEPYRELAILHTLPGAWFVDPFEKNRVVSGAGGASNSSEFSFTSWVVSDVDLESIEALSRPVQHALVGRVRVPAKGPRKPTAVDVGVRMHARYAKLLEKSSEENFRAASLWSWLLSDTVTVTFEPFAVVVRSPTGHCRRLLPTLERVLETELPAGAGRHWVLVQWASILVLTLAVCYIAGVKI